MPGDRDYATYHALIALAIVAALFWLMVWSLL